MSQSDDLQSPIIVKVDGEDVSFPRLDMGDLETWANQLAAKRKQNATIRLNIDTKLSPYERQQLLHAIDNEEIELGHVLARSYTPTGIRKVLVDSLTKTGRKTDDVVRVLGRIHFTAQSEIARKVMSPPTQELAAHLKDDAGAVPLPENESAVETSLSSELA